jgi:hypothetical protein
MIQWADAHATKSGGRQPAVRVGNTFAQTQAHLFGRPPTVYLRIALALALYRYHGGLTPPALVLVYGRLRAKKRFLRCANAHSQERRASARRGSVTHLQRRFVEATGRRNRRVAVSLLQTRLANHGWLTPAAPRSMPECRRKDASSIYQHASSSTAGLRQPLLVHGVCWLQHARFATCRRTCDQERRAASNVVDEMRRTPPVPQTFSMQQPPPA